MSTLAEIPNKAVPVIDTITVNKIAQGDRTSRFELQGADGNAPVALADDIFCSYYMAEPIKAAMREAGKLGQQLSTEADRLLAMIEEWKEKHRNTIDMDETCLSKTISRSSSGKCRFSFFVVPQEGQYDFLDQEIVSLDQQILEDPSFKIVRLDSVLL